MSEEKNIKKTKPNKGGKVVDNEKENDMKKEEIKPVESKDEETEEKKNKKPRGFMQSCFPLFVYFKCLSEFLLYFL